MFATTYNGACKSIGGNCFTSNLPPRPGKGTASISGQSYDATAVCDIDFAPYGKGYGILIGQEKAIILYNMRQGTNQLGDFEKLIDDSNGDIPTSPFAAFFDISSSAFYFSVSGTATVSGKTASASGVFKEVGGSRQISVSASGNCQ
ncbi:hypothetical protein GCM10027423_41680 [Spirosoma arcticum]